MATNPAEMTPVEIDTVLSENYEKQAKTWASIAGTVKTVDRLRKSKYGTLTEIDRFLDIEAQLRAKMTTLISESAPFQVEYNSRPWNRYFLVTNGNGHVHRGMDCSTCFRTTQYNWLVDLADCNEDAMIAEWGERACTVCFPSAPTNPLFNRPARVDREAREAKAAEQAAKAAAKAEKAITDVDGSPLKDRHGYTLKTKVAARNELSQAFQYLVFYGSLDSMDAIRRLVPALEAAGVDWQKAASNAIKKAFKDTQDARIQGNTWGLTDEQIETHNREILANLALAQALLQEVL
jgi:hypothetical protein